MCIPDCASRKALDLCSRVMLDFIKLLKSFTPPPRGTTRPVRPSQLNLGYQRPEAQETSRTSKRSLQPPKKIIIIIIYQSDCGSWKGFSECVPVCSYIIFCVFVLISSGLKGFFKIQHIRSGESQGLKSITSIEREENL